MDRCWTDLLNAIQNHETDFMCVSIKQQEMFTALLQDMEQYVSTSVTHEQSGRYPL
jgi:hypothetical protein